MNSTFFKLMLAVVAEINCINVGDLLDKFLSNFKYWLGESIGEIFL